MQEGLHRAAHGGHAELGERHQVAVVLAHPVDQPVEQIELQGFFVAVDDRDFLGAGEQVAFVDAAPARRDAVASRRSTAAAASSGEKP